MDNLTVLEKEIISDRKAELKSKTFWAMQKIKENGELVGLYQDIIAETSKHGKGTTIFDYAKLLEEQNQLYSAEEAYLFAKNADYFNAKEILKQYLLNINKKMNENGLCSRQQQIFDEIHCLLGDTYTLITDFTETYRRVNGAVADNIGFFISLGWIARLYTVFAQYEKSQN